MQVKRFGRRGRRQFLGRLCSRLAGLLVGPAHQRLQQVPRVLEITLPQQPRPLTGHAVSRVGGQRVVSPLYPARR